MSDFAYLDENVIAVRQRIRKAALECGRDPADILLLAAVKYASSEEIDHLSSRHGIGDVGENRVNTLLEHYEHTERDHLNYHFIGTLQKNKVKYIYDKISLLHSLDSYDLALEIDKRCAPRERVMDALVEINIAREDSKGGISPEELADFASSVKEIGSIHVRGFMTMAPAGLSQADYTEYFTRTAALSKKVWKEVLGREGTPVLSMGMSGSLEAAIRCGSSCVRIGSDIFKKREE